MHCLGSNENTPGAEKSTRGVLRFLPVVIVVAARVTLPLHPISLNPNSRPVPAVADAFFPVPWDPPAVPGVTLHPDALPFGNRDPAFLVVGRDPGPVFHDG